MSDTPSLVAGSPDTPGSIYIFIGSGSSLSTTKRLVISVVGENETGGLGTGPSKHTGGNRTRELNSWEIFKKLHQKKNGSFVDAKSKSINDKMKAVIATALLGPSDDSSEGQELNINRMYFDVVGGAKKQCVYGLGSQASTLYKEQNSVNSASLVSDHVAKERITTLEKVVSQMRGNQERVLQERVEAEVQQ
ncbi:hypothetical protein P3S67_010654 [Capsicum chacoense]